VPNTTRSACILAVHLLLSTVFSHLCLLQCHCPSSAHGCAPPRQALKHYPSLVSTGSHDVSDHNPEDEAREQKLGWKLVLRVLGEVGFRWFEIRWVACPDSSSFPHRTRLCLAPTRPACPPSTTHRGR